MIVDIGIAVSDFGFHGFKSLDFRFIVSSSDNSQHNRIFRVNLLLSFIYLF